jgi:hypothetical protein
MGAALAERTDVGRYQALTAGQTAETARGLAYVERSEREGRVRGRDAARCCPSRDAPGEQQDEDEQQGRHAQSLYAQVPAGKTPPGTCGQPNGSAAHTHHRHAAQH